MAISQYLSNMQNTNSSASQGSGSNSTYSMPADASPLTQILYASLNSSGTNAKPAEQQGYANLLSQFAGGLLDKPMAYQPAYSAYPMSPSASYAPNMVNYFGMPGAYAGTPFDYSQGMNGGMGFTPFNFSKGLLG